MKLYRHTMFTATNYPVSVYTQRLSDKALRIAARALVGMLLNIDTCEYAVSNVGYSRDVSGAYVYEVSYTLLYDTEENTIVLPMYSAEVRPLD
jgi:hypothetical protein